MKHRLRKRTRRKITLSVLFAAAASAVLLKPGVADAPPAPPEMADLLVRTQTTQLHLEEKIAVVQKQQEQKRFEQMRREVVSEVTGLPLDVSDVLVSLSDEYSFNLHDVLGLISVETGGTFDWTLVGGPNTDGSLDWGLMQLNDGGTLQWLQSVTPGISSGDPLDPIENIKMGMWYLHYLSTTVCDGDWECVTSRYNGDLTGRYTQRVIEHSSRMGSRIHEIWGR